MLGSRQEAARGREPLFPAPAIPATVSLSVFVWLLTLHPTASGRVYASYGAVYIGAALAWLYVVGGVTPSWNDVAGASLALLGAGIIAPGHRP